MLEIEDNLNRSNKEIRSLESALANPNAQKRANKELELEEKKIEKRFWFECMQEIFYLKKDGAGILPSDNPTVLNNLINAFRSSDSNKGGDFSDYWIRREITSSPVHGSAIFLTCDLVNALASIAEDLNTIYFIRSDLDLRRNVNPSTLLYNACCSIW